MLLAAALVLACCAPRDGAVSGGYVGAGAGATFRDRPMAR
jgi:L-aminopeptidase/D-esterase-like protein